MTGTDHSPDPDMTKLAPARQKAYLFLSASFTQPPSEEIAAVIRDEAFLDAIKTLFSADTLASLRNCVRSSEGASDFSAQTRDAFMRLFKVPGSHYVHPYESVYRDKRDIGAKGQRQLLMGPSAVDVQRWYRLAALDVSPDCAELPDHIGMELNYVAHLCAKEQQFAAAGDQAKRQRAREMQRDFLATHITPWIGALRDQIVQKSPHDYFKAVANLSVELSCNDLALLERVLGPALDRPLQTDQGQQRKA